MQVVSSEYETAAEELGIDFELIKVIDSNEIIGFGVMSTPALVVDGNIKFSGSIPLMEEIKQRLI